MLSCNTCFKHEEFVNNVFRMKNWERLENPLSFKTNGTIERKVIYPRIIGSNEIFHGFFFQYMRHVQ